MDEQVRGVVQVDFNVLSLIISLVSLALSVIIGGIAIWLSWIFKREADRVNERTMQLLIDIRTDAKAITSFAIPELTRYGEAGRQALLGSMSSSQATIKVDIPTTESQEHRNATDR